MSVQFNQTSNTALYIQNILRQNYIPRCVSLTPYLEQELGDAFLNSKEPTVLRHQQFYRGTKFKQDWKFGSRVLNLTYNLTSNQNYYSSEVHEQLGWYLRAYRDYYKVDVMGLYNCFSGRLVSKIVLPVTQDNSSFSVKWWRNGTATTSVKTTCFPIQLGSKYIIKVKNSLSGPILSQPLFFNGTDLVHCSSDATDTNEYLWLPEASNWTGSSFIYDASLSSLNPLGNADTTKQLMNCNKQLYLFIQVPTSEDLCMSVVEEAGYINASHRTLLEDPDTIGQPFSDKLLEYLTGHAITPATEILPNIEMIQRIMNSEEFTATYGRKLGKYSSGIFDESMQRILYQALLNPEGTNSTINKYMTKGYIPDFTGCVDKDVEQLLWAPLKTKTKEDLLKTIGV